MENSKEVEVEEAPFDFSSCRIGVLLTPANAAQGYETIEMLRPLGAKIVAVLPEDEEAGLIDLLIICGDGVVSDGKYSYDSSGKFDFALFHFARNYLIGYVEKVAIFGINSGMLALLCPLLTMRFVDKHVSDHTNQQLIIAEELKMNPITVNSRHRQGFYTSDISPDGPIQVLASYEGVMEAFISRTRRIAGVQWNPEKLRHLPTSLHYRQTKKTSGDPLTFYLIEKLLYLQKTKV